MPNFNQTLNSINQGMKILEMAQGKGTGSSHAAPHSPSNYPSSSSSNYPPSNYPSSNYPPSNYPPSNYPSSSSSSHGYPTSSTSPSSSLTTLSKIIGGVEKSFLSPCPSTSPHPTSPRPANYNYTPPPPSNDLQNLFAACNAEISYHQNAILNLRNLREMTERNAREALGRNEAKILQFVQRIKEQESLAARANNIPQASQLAREWQQAEQSHHTRHSSHQRTLEQNLFDYDRAIQQHQLLLDTLSRQLAELHSGIARPPLVDHSIRDPLPFSVPLEEAFDCCLSYGGYSSIPPRTPSPSPSPSFSGNMSTPGYYAPQASGHFLAVPAALSPSASPLPSPPLSSFPGYPPASSSPAYPAYQAPSSPNLGFRF